MPQRPRSPAPRARFRSIVSALSSAVCAVAMAMAPILSAVSSKKAYLSLLAASSSLRPMRAAKAATSPRPK